MATVSENALRLTTLALFQCPNEYKLQIMREFSRQLYIRRILSNKDNLSYEYRVDLIRISDVEAHLRELFLKYQSADGDFRTEMCGTMIKASNGRTVIFLSHFDSNVNLSSRTESQPIALDLSAEALDEVGKFLLPHIYICFLVWKRKLPQESAQAPLLAEIRERMYVPGTECVESGGFKSYFWDRMREEVAAGTAPEQVLRLADSNSYNCCFTDDTCTCHFYLCHFLDYIDDPRSGSEIG